jgi:site-specific recombinase XerD
MTATTTSTALVTVQPVFTESERLALAGFLAGYRGLTREAYTLDLRQFTVWCRVRSLSLFAVRRADIETFARDLEAEGRARATVTRRLCTIAGFYKYAVEEELLQHSPAAHVRRPRLDYESHATALDRNELSAILVAAGLGPPAEHALISLLALNGLRVSEATGADIEQLGLERGHRTLVITRKDGKVVTIPLAPRTARAIDLAINERTEGALFLTADRRRPDRHGAARIVRRVTRRAGISKQVSPHTLRHAFITAALDAGVPLRDVQEAASHADPHHDEIRPGTHQPRQARHLYRRCLYRRSSTLTPARRTARPRQSGRAVRPLQTRGRK